MGTGVPIISTEKSPCGCGEIRSHSRKRVTIRRGAEFCIFAHIARLEIAGTFSKSEARAVGAQDRR